jgi:hypothetical protein
MKTATRYSALYLFGLALALLVLSAPIVRAQQAMEVPAPVPQSKSTLNYRPKPTPRPTPQPQVIDQSNQQNQTQVVPTVPRQHVQPTPEPPPQASQNRQPVLPEVFRGCWQGKVKFLDSIERLPGAAKVGTWTPKTYRLCYERYGNGPFQLTFSEAGIDQSHKIINARSTIDLVSTDGRTYATMRALLHFDEYRYGDSSGDTFEVDEVARLQCEIRPDGMHVIGTVRGTRDGDPWFRAYWHTVFIHVPG